MALNDFDDEDDFEDLEAGSPEAIAEFDPLEEERADLDEDLFDFPDPLDVQDFNYPGPPTAVSASATSPEPAAPLPEAASRPEAGGAGSLLSGSSEAPGVPSGSNAANHELSPLAPRSPYFDPAVDEDLYDFPNVFAGGHATEDVAPATDVPPVRPLDPLGLGLEQQRSRGEEATPPPSVENERPEAPARRSTPSVDDTFDDSGPLTVAPPPAFTAAMPATARGRLLEVLAVAFLVLNTGLVLFAWQANSSFHDTLEAVTRTVSETLAAGPARGEPVAVRVPIEGAAPATLDEEPSTLADFSLESLETAREMLAAGQYMDARRRLYRLLASADASGIEPRVATEAEFLIAESYELQGRALAEEGR